MVVKSSLCSKTLNNLGFSSFVWLSVKTSPLWSWIWAISIGMAVCSIGLSLRYRTPITIAWSTPGAALLITSLGGVSYGEAIGAYMTCAVLVTIVGLRWSFDFIS